MASDEDFVLYLAEQMHTAGVIRYKKMFGEYAFYCNEKVVALVCDNQLFVKPTQAGRLFIHDIKEAPAYPGAKLSFLIEWQYEDSEWISELIKITTKELPTPKPKAPKLKSPKQKKPNTKDKEV
ncbi:MAG: TfoX/Sxy family protein [Pseudomonadota bacterium]